MRADVSLLVLVLGACAAQLQVVNDVVPVTRQLIRLVKQITSKYFVTEDSRCIVTITDHDSDIVPYVPLTAVPMFLVMIQEAPGGDFPGKRTKKEELEASGGDSPSKRTKKEMQEAPGGYSPGDERTKKQILAGLDLHCLGFVIQVVDADYVVGLIADLLRHSSQREGRRYLVVPSLRRQGPLLAEPGHRVHHRAATSILDHPAMAVMPDLIVALPAAADTTTFQILTHKFTGIHTWQDHVVLDTWTDDAFLHNVDLYPDKVTNGLGRSLTLATFNYPPYSIVDAERGILDGTELRLAAEFATRFNYSWTVLADDGNQWGETWDNMTGNGILGNVLTDRAHFGFGALYLWHSEYRHLDFSSPYIRTGITCLVPKPTPLPGWLTPVLPFSRSMWAAVGGSLALSTLAMYLVACSSNNCLGTIAPRQSLLDCALLSLGLLLLQAPPTSGPTRPETGPGRHLVAWLLVVFLLVGASYSSGLSSVLTVPKFHGPLDTLADLASSRIHWAATHEAWVFSIKQATDRLTTQVYQQFQVMSGEEMKRVARGRRTAFAVERLPAGHFAVQDYLDEEAVMSLRIMREDIYWEQCVTVMRKGSPYMQPFNKLVHSLLDSGILLHWEGRVARGFMTSRVQSELRHGDVTHSHRAPTTLTLAHAQGVFALLIVGLMTSSLVFIAELLL